MHFPAKISVKPVAGLRLKSFSALFFISQLVIPKTFAQVSDDFSDGNFTANPSWSGMDTAFRVNELLQLQLNATAAGTSWLITDFTFDPMKNTEWQFFVKQSFSSSGANFGRLYLMSDRLDLSAPLNGYYLQFGEAGSNDAVELFRQSGTTRVPLCRATPAAIATTFELRIKVTRNPDGRWELFADYSGGFDFVLQNSVNDVTHMVGAYCGIFCTYTITNATRFYYDDVFITTSPAPDVTAPQIVSLETTAAHSLRLVFSEQVQKASAENLTHYSVSPAMGNPVSAVLSEDQKIVDLTFSGSFANGYHSSLSVQNVMDLAGNIMLPTDSTFLFFTPMPVDFKEVIFSEFLSDPSPSVGLPEAEFAEIHNRSENAIDLSGWTLADETSTSQLSHRILPPHAYLILAATANAEKFTSMGNVHAVDGFPALNNAGDKLILKTPDGTTVDSIRYDATWYEDGEKADGGWSFELIDPENICADAANWSASDDPAGGTPGIQNSVFANRPDNRGPQIVSVVPLDDTTILITFNEKLESKIPGAGQFAISPSIAVSSVRFEDASLTSMLLSLASRIQSSTRYTIIVSDVYDCPGNNIQEDYSKADFVFPGKASPGDVVVNEILFNPRPTGVDFVEVYNRSDKSLDLKNWALRNSVGSGHTTVISREHLLIHSKEYKVLTEDMNLLKGEYPSGAEQSFTETTLPALNDDEGSVAIVAGDGMVIDSMLYSNKMHSAFIQDDEGISLERISSEAVAGDNSNWRSASSVSGFATPGYVNSNARGDLHADAGSVTVEPEIIQPFVHGHDFARIKYNFKRGGFMANVRILDQQGRSVREIAGNALLGTEGFFRWDGDLDNGSRARTGYYMVWFETFDDARAIARYTKRVAVF